MIERLSLPFAIPKSGSEGANLSSRGGSLGRGEEGLYKGSDSACRRESAQGATISSCLVLPVVPLASGTFLGSLLLPTFLAIIMSPTPHTAFQGHDLYTEGAKAVFAGKWLFV